MQVIFIHHLCLSMLILLYVYVHTVCYIALAWCSAALSACDLFALSYWPAALAGYLSITFVEVRSLSGYFASLVIVVKATSVGELSHLNVYLSILIVIFSILYNDNTSCLCNFCPSYQQPRALRAECSHLDGLAEQFARIRLHLSTRCGAFA